MAELRLKDVDNALYAKIKASAALKQQTVREYILDLLTKSVTKGN